MSIPIIMFSREHQLAAVSIFLQSMVQPPYFPALRTLAIASSRVFVERGYLWNVVFSPVFVQLGFVAGSGGQELQADHPECSQSIKVNRQAWTPD